MAKTGRPPLDNPRDYRITVRVDKSEREILNKVCEMTGKGKNDAIRTALLRYYDYLKKEGK